jgi:hypothetical protein
MVQPKWTILVLFYDRGGTHLFAMFNGSRPQMTEDMHWRSLENSLKAEARFFNRTAANQLASMFDGIDALTTREGRPLVIDAGPGTDFHTLYRARVFRSDDELEAALGRPDLYLGSPPGPLAAAGRMNARGISVFHAANSRKAAIAEMRPPVGSRIAVAQFEIIRKLRLLDLTALDHIRGTESLADFGLAGRRTQAMFLRSMSGRIVRPVMSDDEPLDDLSTQAIVDFLATEASVPVDGIIFRSVQAAGDAVNVVLFHKAARVETINVPEGMEISARAGRWTEDGWMDDYEVLEKVPPFRRAAGTHAQGAGWPDVTAITDAMLLDPRDADWRDDSLRIVPESVEVHRVRRVEIATDEFSVKRHRGEKAQPMQAAQVTDTETGDRP